MLLYCHLNKIPTWGTFIKPPTTKQIFICILLSFWFLKKRICSTVRQINILKLDKHIQWVFNYVFVENIYEQQFCLFCEPLLINLFVCPQTTFQKKRCLLKFFFLSFSSPWALPSPWALSVVCPPSSVNFSHFNLLLWNPLSQMNWNLVGSIYGRSSIKIAHFVPIH